MKTAELLEFLDLDAIYGVDFETFWSKEFTLKKLPTTEYIFDPRFKTHMASVQRHDQKRGRVYNAADLQKVFDDTDWSRTGFLAHHTHFDGLIASKYFGVNPAIYLDTLSMARPIMPVTVGGSLYALNAAFGRQSKKRAGVLLNTQGIETLNGKEFRQMAAYAADDIADTWFLFWKFLPFLPLDELWVIDATIRMYAQPRVLINEAKVQALHDTEVAEKLAILKTLKVTAEQLRSKNQFAKLLIAEGVDPPEKISKKTGDITYAFSKTDLEFKALLGHKRKRVRELVRGRFRHSSSIMEKRALRMARRAPLGPQPVYLNYALAHTYRWTGGDKMNWQNFKRGSDLRSAIEAPEGYIFVVADSAQIEARLNACFAGQADKVELFRRGEDVYAHTASAVYRRPINKKDNPLERFVGKTGDLSLGYQAGAVRFAHTLRTGQMGPPVDISDEDAKAFVAGWRQTNYRIKAGWRETQIHVKSAFISKTCIEHGCVAYEGVGRHGYMHLPNGMSLRYAELEVSDEGQVSYLMKSRKKVKGGTTDLRKTLYGGILVENRTQALSRVLLAAWIVELRREATFAQLVMTTHDEVVYLVPKRRAEKFARLVKRVMTTPPDWMPTLPLGVDLAITPIYEKPE